MNIAARFVGFCALLFLADVAAAVDLATYAGQSMEVTVRGEPIVRDDFDACEPKGAVLIDEEKPDHWQLRVKSWPGVSWKMLGAVGSPPEIAYDPKLQGTYDVYLGIRSVNWTMSFGIRLSSENDFTAVTAPMSVPERHCNLEFCWKRATVLDGQKIHLKSLGKSVFLSYIKFVPIIERRETIQTAIDHVVICREPGKHFAFPGVARLKSGEILAVFRDGKEHVEPTGCVAMCRSTDGGRTWSPRTTIYDDPDADERDPAILQHSDGTVLVSFESHGSKTIRSADDGRTWDKPMAAPVFSPHGPIQAPDGLLYYCGIRQAKGMSHVDVVRSDDKGASWTPWGNVSLSLPFHEPWIRPFYDEPFAMPVSATRWLCMQRVDLDGYVYQSSSDDNGRTWTDLPDKTPIWGHPCHLLRLGDGRILCTYGYRRSPFGIRACVSRDEGRTWDMEHEIVLRADGGGDKGAELHVDIGYPVSIELDNGVVLAVYYFNDKARPNECFIAGTFFRP